MSWVKIKKERKNGRTEEAVYRQARFHKMFSHRAIPNRNPPPHPNSPNRRTPERHAKNERSEQGAFSGTLQSLHVSRVSIKTGRGKNKS